MTPRNYVIHTADNLLSLCKVLHNVELKKKNNPPRTSSIWKFTNLSFESRHFKSLLVVRRSSSDITYYILIG